MLQLCHQAPKGWLCGRSALHHGHRCMHPTLEFAECLACCQPCSKYVEPTLEHCRRNFKTVVPLPAINQVQTLCKVGAATSTRAPCWSATGLEVGLLARSCNCHASRMDIPFLVLPPDPGGHPAQGGAPWCTPARQKAAGAPLCVCLHLGVRRLPASRQGHRPPPAVQPLVAERAQGGDFPSRGEASSRGCSGARCARKRGPLLRNGANCSKVHAPARLQGTVFDYYVDEQNVCMAHWSQRVPQFTYIPGADGGESTWHSDIRWSSVLFGRSLR